MAAEVLIIVISAITVGGGIAIVGGLLALAKS